MASDNKTLARFILDGIPPAPRGIPQVEVVFDIDANGILNVSAKDKASGKSQSVKIEASTSLSKDEIERLKNEAAQHATDDANKRALAEERNQAESLVYLAEKSLREAGEKVTDATKASVTEKLEALKKVKDSEDIEALKSAVAALSAEIQKIGQEAYNNQSTQNEQPGGESSTEPKSS
jgi:molecular chaperone DnaK